MLSIDPEKTRVVLIGASRFPNDPASLDELPAVAANLEDLKATLVDPQSVGIPPENITVMLDPPIPSAVVPVVAAAAREAEDAFIFYYAGHGLVGRGDLQLYLAVGQTVQEQADLGTAVEYNMVRRAIRQSTANKRIVVLDCCFSGRALEGLMSSESDLLQANLDLEGTYTLASSPANTASMAPVGEKYTAFTGALINVLREGLETEQEELSLDDLFIHLRDLQRQRGLPEPQQSARQDAAQFLIARNRGFRPGQPPEPEAKPEPQKLPAELQQAIENPLAGVRRGAVDELRTLLARGNPALRHTARLALQELILDDSRSVSTAAEEALVSEGVAEPPATPSRPPRQPGPAGASSKPAEPQQEPAPASAPSEPISAGGNATDSAPTSTTTTRAPAAPERARLRVRYQKHWGRAGVADGRFTTPEGIAVDASGQVYVVDSEHHRIQVFTNDGEFVRKWGSRGNSDINFNGPRAVAIDRAGNVYVADSLNHRVSVFTLEGQFIKHWGSSGTTDGRFNRPYGVAVDQSGRVYVADEDNHRLQVFDSEGRFLTKWGSNDTAAGEFDSIHEIAIDTNGNVYTSETSWLATRVQMFNSDGKFVRQIGTSGGAPGQYGRPAGIAVDAIGRIYVVDAGNHRVLIYGADGKFIRSWGQSGRGNGQFNSPSGIAVDSRGRIFVVDRGNHRVQVFALRED